MTKFDFIIADGGEPTVYTATLLPDGDWEISWAFEHNQGPVWYGAAEIECYLGDGSWVKV